MPLKTCETSVSFDSIGLNASMQKKAMDRHTNVLRDAIYFLSCWLQLKMGGWQTSFINTEICKMYGDNVFNAFQHVENIKVEKSLWTNEWIDQLTSSLFELLIEDKNVLNDPKGHTIDEILDPKRLTREICQELQDGQTS